MSNVHRGVASNNTWQLVRPESTPIYLFVKSGVIVATKGWDAVVGCPLEDVLELWIKAGGQKPVCLETRLAPH